MTNKTITGSFVGAISIALSACGPNDPTAIDLEPPADGVQIGTPAFDVAPGTEVQHCYYFKLPSNRDLDVTLIQIRYLEGSHHMNLFQSDQDVPDHDEECWMKVAFSGPDNPTGWDLIVGSQSTSLDWKLPPGVAFHFPAHRQLMLQTHYVNAATRGNTEVADREGSREDQPRRGARSFAGHGAHGHNVRQQREHQHTSALGALVLDDMRHVERCEGRGAHGPFPQSGQDIQREPCGG